jgi:hypothetical protein
MKALCKVKVQAWRLRVAVERRGRVENWARADSGRCSSLVNRRRYVILLL